MVADGGAAMAVTAATGALGPVLAKLTALLGSDLNQSTRSDMEFIVSELKPVYSLLLRIWEREDLEPAVKDWMAEARNLSFGMDDDIDGFMLGDDTSLPFERHKLQVQDLVNRCCQEWLTLADQAITTNQYQDDPRSRFLHKDASDLLEAEEKKADMIELLQDHEMVCILGSAGMGKTTLVDLVYRTIGDQFRCRAFISVSQRTDMAHALTAILNELNAGYAAPSAGNQDAAGNRYLVIIDDIWHWEQWEVIRKCLPEYNVGSRIIMTTRLKTIAEKCRMGTHSFVYELEGLSMDAAAALSERKFKEYCRDHDISSDMLNNQCSFIAKMSGGMPLAVICLSSAIASQLTTEEGQSPDPDTAARERFHTAERRALEDFLSIPLLKPLVENLYLGYRDLPLNLKTCLLHCSIYPPYSILGRDVLTRMWIAEGFVIEEKEARSYADELDKRGLIRRCSLALALDRKYEMNPTMLHFLRCKSQDCCFAASLDCGSHDISSPHERKVSRLSVESSKNKVDISKLHVSDIRSLYVFDHTWRPPLKEFKHLRVLHLHSNPLDNPDMVDVCGLLRLRWLSLKGTLINLLPKQIGRLKHLKTLNVSNTGILHLPNEIGELHHLEILDVSNTMVAVLPEEIGRLQHLKTLYARNSSVRVIPSEITRLKHLETLDIGNTMVAELPEGINELQCLKIFDTTRDVEAENGASLAVNVATGALDLVLVKLGALLCSEEVTDLVGSFSIIELIMSEFKAMHSFLLMVWEREDLEAACKDWIEDARNLSYHMEGDIDNFLLSLEHGHGTINRAPLIRRLHQRIQGLLDRFCADWMTLTQTIINSNCSKQIPYDPRSRFLHHHAWELVEMDEKKDELIQLLQEHEMVCIHGFAGVGKTTLADVVCQERGQDFECVAFVSVSPRPNMTQILRSILTQLVATHVPSTSSTDAAAENRSGMTPPETEQCLIDSISKILEDKRYLVIVDDIWRWEQWEVIRRSLPKNNPSSRVITTTRVNAIAEKCHAEYFASVYEIGGLSMGAAAGLSEMVFMEACEIDINPSDIDRLCNSVAEMSGGVPLSIICMSRAVANQLTPEVGEELDLDTTARKRFQLAESRVLEGFLNIPCLKPLVESFCLGYQYLPLHLKTCLLHCSMYPPYHILEKDNLIRMWIAERFVYEAEEARSYAEELVSMGFIRCRCSAVHASALKYEMDAMMLHFLRCKSQEHSFIASLDCGSVISYQNARRIRRLSIQSYQRKVDISRLRVSNTHSVHVFDVPLKEFKHLRELYLHGNHLESANLVDISGMLWLRCLSLNGALINLLPTQIGGLKGLKTLILSNTGILRLPIEIGELHDLEIMDVSNTMVQVVPDGIGKLMCLKTLDAKNSSLRVLPEEIGDLQNLVTLDLSNTMVKELPMGIRRLQRLKTLNVSDTEVAALPTEIFELQCLEMLDVSITKITEVPKDIKKLKNLRTLKISNTDLQELHEEIGKLEHLETFDLSNTEVTTLPRVLRKLQHLKTLNISHTGISELDGEAGQRSNPLHVLAGDRDSTKLVQLLGGVCQDFENDDDPFLKDLSIILFDRDFFDSMRWELAPRFKVRGKQMDVPPCVGNHLTYISSLEISLWKLDEADLRILREIHNLRVLLLRVEVLRRKPTAITDEGFQQLESFSFDCRVPRVKFYKGAMPKLKRLEFKFYACRETDESMGISHLMNLERVVFRSSPGYTSDSPGILAIIKEVSKEAEEHPNRITLSINGNDKVFTKKKSGPDTSLPSGSESRSEIESSQ